MYNCNSSLDESAVTSLLKQMHEAHKKQRLNQKNILDACPVVEMRSIAGMNIEFGKLRHRMCRGTQLYNVNHCLIAKLNYPLRDISTSKFRDRLAISVFYN